MSPLCHFGQRVIARMSTTPDKPPKKPREESVSWTLPHPKWSEEELKNVKIDHKTPKTFGDRFANFFIQSLRIGFDVMSGYKKILPM